MIISQFVVIVSCYDCHYCYDYCWYLFKSIEQSTYSRCLNKQEAAIEPMIRLTTIVGYLKLDGAIAKPFLKGNQIFRLFGTGGSLAVSYNFTWCFFPSEHIACWWSVRCFALLGDPKTGGVVGGGCLRLKSWLVCQKRRKKEEFQPCFWSFLHVSTQKHEELGCWENAWKNICAWSRCIAHVMSTGVTGSLR